MYTAEGVDALRDRLESEGASKAEIVKRLAWACMGWPYVYGTYGQMCTPKIRKEYAGYHPEYKANIYNACPALRNGNDKEHCTGCKWQGVRCFDCEGFPRWLMAQVGLQIYGSGATTQWETASNWAATGTIDTLPVGLICCLFKRKEGKMSHEGLHAGGGEIVHCSTTVKPDALPGRPAWTHWAVPAGLYSDEDLRKAGIDVENGKNLPTLRKGATGNSVAWMQLMLIEEDGAKIEADGIFGEKTEEAVKHFQRTHGLTVDGVCGPKTWAALESCEDRPSALEGGGEAPEASPAADPSAPAPEPEKPPDDSVVISCNDWNAIKAAVSVLMTAVKKYE